MPQKKHKDHAARQKAYRERQVAVDADEWTWDWSEKFPEENAELTTYEKDFAAKVSAELGRTPDDETLGWVTTPLFSFKKDKYPWVRDVTNGVIVGGTLYPDVLGSGLVENTHRFELEKSPSYSFAYRELLTILDNRFGHNVNGSEGASARDIKADLAGKYVLPVSNRAVL